MHLKAIEGAKWVIGYYNWTDWKDKKGKKGNLTDEYIGYIVETEKNVWGEMEELTTVWAEETIE